MAVSRFCMYSLSVYVYLLFLLFNPKEQTNSFRELVKLLNCLEEPFQHQRALAFTPQQYLVAERHTGNVCFVNDNIQSLT